MLSKFRTKKNRLTLYAFGCGYVEKRAKGDIETTLWHDGCFHVRQHDHANHNRIFWECFDTIGEARRFFDNPEFGELR